MRFAIYVYYTYTYTLSIAKILEVSGKMIKEFSNKVMNFESQSVYYVVICNLKYTSFEEAKNAAPDEITSHIRRSKDLHQVGTLLMSGAFLDKTGDHLKTMAILTSKEAAEEYIKGDPFYLNGMMESWEVRQWANMFFK